MTYDNPWIYQESPYNPEELDKDLIGFVYLITNLKNNRKYLGKKLFWSSKTRQVKLKKKKFKIESDWQTYYGSSEELQKDVELFGSESFKREILRLCYSKGECSYFEAKFQFETDAILREEYYNSWLSVRVRKSHLKGLDISNKE